MNILTHLPGGMIGGFGVTTEKYPVLLNDVLYDAGISDMELILKW